MQKKRCAKRRIEEYIRYKIHLCQRCPVQEKCVRYWQEKKACWDAKIDKICPWKECRRMGYCKKPEMSSICDYMGPFKQACGQFFGNDQQVRTSLLTVGKDLLAQRFLWIYSRRKSNNRKAVRIEVRGLKESDTFSSFCSEGDRPCDEREEFPLSCTYC